MPSFSCFRIEGLIDRGFKAEGIAGDGATAGVENEIPITRRRGGEGMKNRDEEIDAERSKPLVGKGQIAQCQVQKGREKSEARSSKGRDQDRITNMRL